MADKLTPEQRRKCMAAIKGANTRPEMIVRKFLFAKGLRYRVNNRKLPGSPDIVLRKYKTVVFVDGCFWHGHEGCRYFKLPESNRQYWEHKIRLNYAHDYRANVELKLLGWQVIRIWECELRNKALQSATLNRVYSAITASQVRTYDYENERHDEAAERRSDYISLNQDYKSGEGNRHS